MLSPLSCSVQPVTAGSGSIMSRASFAQSYSSLQVTWQRDKLGGATLHPSYPNQKL